MILHTGDEGLPVVSVAVMADRHVKLHLIISIIGLRLPQVPLDTGTPQHDSTAGNTPRLHKPSYTVRYHRHRQRTPQPEAIAESFVSGNDTDILRPLHPYPVVREQVIHFIDSLTKLSRPVIDVVQQTDRKVLYSAIEMALLCYT